MKFIPGWCLQSSPLFSAAIPWQWLSLITGPYHYLVRTQYLALDMERWCRIRSVVFFYHVLSMEYRVSCIEYEVWSLVYWVWRRIVLYWVWSTESGLFSMVYGVWYFECAARSIMYWVWSIECGVLSVEFGMLFIEFGMQAGCHSW